MAQEWIVQGLVLRRWSAQEADKWISLLTPDYGKLRLRVRGAQKLGSRMGMLSEPLNILRTRVIQGRQQQLMVQPQMVATFVRVRGDLERLSAALALLELLDRWLPEAHAEPQVYTTALAGLNALERGQDTATIMGWALWRLLYLLGYSPALDACARCRATDCEGEWVLEPQEGHLLCAACARGTHARTRLSQAQRATLQQWLQMDTPASEWERVRSEESQALLQLAVRYAEHHLEDSPRWLEFLTRLNTPTAGSK
jgi:DNA repair protein RecO (recombination protein O)